MDVPQDMMTRYLERRIRELEDCQRFLADKQFTKLEKVGHQLRGNGVTFGFPELSSIGIKLEQSSQDKDLPSTHEALQEFSRWVEEHRLN
jgi:HPt (histidine-containing phosphotransfer) domain-containing protein